MAYPTIDAPYGLKPINLVGGQANVGSIRQIPIASGYATAVFAGDLVTLVADGSVEKDAGTTTATPVGVFVGCKYTDPNLGYELYSQSYPGNVAADDIEAYVVDDPSMLFKVAVVSAGTTIGGVDRTAVGSNVALVQNAGNAATGNSGVAVLQGSVATTATLPLRVVDVVKDTMVGGVAQEVVVKINAGVHQYNNATGV